MNTEQLEADAPVAEAAPDPMSVENGAEAEQPKEEDHWATGGWLDDETGAGWGEEGGVQGGDEAGTDGGAERPGDSSSPPPRGDTFAPFEGRGGRGAGRGGGRGGLAPRREGGQLPVGGMVGGRGSYGLGRGGRGSVGLGGPMGLRPPEPGGTRFDVDSRGAPAPQVQGPPPGQQDYGWPPHQHLSGGHPPRGHTRGPYAGPPGAPPGPGPYSGPPPPHEYSLPPPRPPPIPSPFHDYRGPPYGSGQGAGPQQPHYDPRYNGRPPDYPPPHQLPPPHHGAPHHHALPPPHHHAHPHAAQLLHGGHLHHLAPPPHHHHVGVPGRKAAAADLPPIQSFQKFMTEQTDEPSPQESFQRYAEYKYKYVEDYATLFFEERKNEEWFQERYLPSKRHAKQVQAKTSWAKDEGQRFKAQLLQQPDLFVVSVSLDPASDLEYIALSKKYSKAGTLTQFGADGISPASNDGVSMAVEGSNTAETGHSTPVNGSAHVAEGGDAATTPGGSGLTHFDGRLFEGHADSTLFLRTIPSEVPRAYIEAAARERGGPFVRLVLSDPAKTAYCTSRSGWLIYASKEAAEAARLALHNTELTHPDEAQIAARQASPPLDYFKPFTLQLYTHNGRKTMQAPAEMSEPKRVDKDVRQSLELASALDQEKGLDAASGEGLEALLSDATVSAELARRNVSFRLDLVMAYLRRVHFVVYYGGEEFQDEGDLIFSAAQLYKRTDTYKPPERPEDLASQPEPKWSEWTQRMDGKLNSLLEIIKAGTRLGELQAALNAQQEAEDKAKRKWLVANMSNEDDEKWRCAAPGCTKLFKASEFLTKHLLNKHYKHFEESLKQMHEELVHKAFDADQDKPLPPVMVDKGSNMVKPVPVGEVLLEVAGVLGKDMSKWKQLVEESSRRGSGGRGRRAFGGALRGGGLPPVLGGSVAGAQQPAPGLAVPHLPAPTAIPGDVGGVIEFPAGPLGMYGVGGVVRSRKPYKDIDVPKSGLLNVDYGEVAAPPPPKRRKKKSGSGGGAGDARSVASMDDSSTA